MAVATIRSGSAARWSSAVAGSVEPDQAAWRRDSGSEAVMVDHTLTRSCTTYTMSGQRTSSMMWQRTAVLIAGGGLVGLTAALVLRHHGVPGDPGGEAGGHLTAAQGAPPAHAQHGDLPRARAGLPRCTRPPATWPGTTIWPPGRTLAEARQLPLWQPQPWPRAVCAPAVALEASPELPCLIAQDTARTRCCARPRKTAGARVRFSTELAGFTQDRRSTCRYGGAGPRTAARDGRRLRRPGTWWRRTGPGARSGRRWASPGPGRVPRRARW